MGTGFFLVSAEPDGPGVLLSELEDEEEGREGWWETGGWRFIVAGARGGRESADEEGCMACL